MTPSERPLDEIRGNLRVYWLIVKRRWRPALALFALVSSLAFWQSQYVKRQFSSTTVFERRDDVVLRNLIDSKSPYSFSQLRATIAQDITGSRALARAAVALELLPAEAITSGQALTSEELRQLEAALRKRSLEARVRLVQSSASLDTIELYCLADDPEMARRFAVAVRDGYIESMRERIAGVLRSARDFFAVEVQRFQEQANAANERLREQYARFPGVDPTEPSSLNARIDVLRGEHLRLALQRADLEAQISARERFLASDLLTEVRIQTVSLPRQAPSPATGAIERAILGVEQELADAIVVRQMTAEHPTVVELRRKLDNLRRTAAETATPSADSTSDAQEQRVQDPALAAQRARVEMELESLRSQLLAAQGHLDQSEQRLAEATAMQLNLQRSSGELQALITAHNEDRATAAIWRQHLQHLERVLIAANDERGTQFAVVEEAKPIGRPVTPRVSAVFVVCLGVGLAAAALFIALREVLDRSLRSPGHVMKTVGLPVLGGIGEIATPRVRRGRIFERLAWGPMLGVLLISLVATSSLAYARLERPTMFDGALQTLSALRSPDVVMAQD